MSSTKLTSQLTGPRFQLAHRLCNIPKDKLLKHKVLKEIGLQGVIRGSGILCYCENCKGMNVVTPTVYEIHAGSLNKRPPDYMYLDNGNTVRDVLNSCKLCKLDDLGATIRKVIGLTAPE